VNSPKNFAERYPELQRVVCAAIRAGDGDIIVGVRHYSPDMIRQMTSREDGDKFEGRCGADQGFVDQWGGYLTREEAWEIAVRQNQIVRDCGDSGVLYSENLY
jgi:hypothetical protein